jgi:hypothetical protein
LDICPNRALLYKILAGMVKRGEIRHAWFLPSGKTGGRPKKILSNRKVESDCLRHEISLTWVLLALGYPCRRLDDVDQRLLPDAEIEVNGELHFGELDTGSERGRKIEERLSIWGTVSDPILWIVMTEQRRQSLRAKDRNENSYFGVWKEVVNNPKGEVWLNVNNQLVTIE